MSIPASREQFKVTAVGAGGSGGKNGSGITARASGPGANGIIIFEW